MNRAWYRHKLILLLLVTGAVYFFLRYLTPLLGPVLVAMLFVTIFGPLLQRLQTRLRIHRQLGAVILLILVCAVVAGLVAILVTWIVGSLPGWLGKLELLEQQVMEGCHGLCVVLEQTLSIDRIYLEQTLNTAVGEGIAHLRDTLPEGMMNRSWQSVKAMGQVAGFLLTFLISTVLLAKDYDEIMNRLLEREEYHVILEVICGIIRYLATFVKAQLIIMGSIATLSGCVLGSIGVPYGVLWGILAGILDALPFVGTGIILVPIGVLQILWGHWGRAACCVVLYLMCIFLRELLEPKLIGRRMGLSPIAVLLSVYVGIGLFGLIGIIKGPLGYVMICRSFESLQRRIYQRADTPRSDEGLQDIPYKAMEG